MPLFICLYGDWCPIIKIIRTLGLVGAKPSQASVHAWRPTGPKRTPIFKPTPLYTCTLSFQATPKGYTIWNLYFQGFYKKKTITLWPLFWKDGKKKKKKIIENFLFFCCLAKMICSKKSIKIMQLFSNWQEGSGEKAHGLVLPRMLKKHLSKVFWQLQETDFAQMYIDNRSKICVRACTPDGAWGWEIFF